MPATTILVLVGSLRGGSTNRQLAEAALELAPADVSLSIYPSLGDLPFYDEDIDLEGSAPETATTFRSAVAAADALLVVTPEHNGTIPAVLKNAIDWASRPFGVGALKDKPVAVIGSAFGQFGGVWAHDEARKALGIAGASVLDEVTLAIPGSLVRFAETHPRDDAEVAEQLRAVVAAVADSASAPAAAPAA